MAEKYKIEFEVDSSGAVKSVEKVDDALKDTGKTAKKELSAIQKGVKKIGQAGKTIASGGLKAIGLGLRGIGKAYLAAGIGIIVSGFTFLYNALKENQEVLDTFNTVFETLSIIGSQVADVIVNVYKSVASATENFDALGKVIKSLLTISITPLKLAFDGIRLGLLSAQLAWEESFFGDEDPETIKRLNESIFETKQSLADTANEAISAGKSIVTNFGEAITEFKDITTQVIDGVKEISIEAAIETAKTNISLKKSAEVAAAENRLLMQQYDRQAEQQRQIRDDESATMEERISANKKLGEILQEQEKIMIQNADAILLSAQAQFEKTGIDEDYIAVLDAQAEKAGVLAAIEGKRSEQLVNTNTLEREALEQKKLLAEEEIEIAEKIASEKKAIQDKAFADAVALAGAESKLGKAILIAKQLLLAKEMIMEMKATLFSAKQSATKTVMKGAEAGVDVSSGAAKTASSLPFPANIPLILGYAVQAAGIIKTIKSAMKSSKQATSKLGVSGSTVNIPDVSTTAGGQTAAQTPSFDILGTSGTNQLAQALGQQAPVQAFVVSQDVTTAQSLQNNIVQGASLG